MSAIEQTIPVMLSVRGEQYFEGVDPDATELVTPADMTIAQDGSISLGYEESELTGMEGTQTTFLIQGNVITLTRSGAVNSQMVFEMGRQHTSLYETPFGELSVDIQTSFLSHTMGENGGTMEIKYSIAVDHTVTGRNKFIIKATRK